MENVDVKLLSGKEILCVDDNPVNICVLEFNFKLLGAKVICAGNGEEALSKFDSGVELVVSDIQMPIMDGNLLAKQVKLVSPKTPVVSYSCSEIPISREYFNSNLKKPFSKEDLLSLIFSQLPLEQLFGQAYRDVCINFSELLEEDSSSVFKETVLPKIKKNILEQYASLAQAFQMGEVERVKYFLHKLKGGCYMSGFKVLGDLLRAVEAAYRAKPSGTDFHSLAIYLRLVIEKFANSEIEYGKS